VANAQAARDRLSGLLARGVAARREVDDAERDLAEAHAAIAEASAGLDSARRMLARQRVTAPFDGVVVRRLHNPGDLVDASAADPILRFADPARIEVEALVPAADVSRVEARQPAEVVAPGGVRWDATVLTTPAVVDATNASARVRLGLRGDTRPPLGLPVETIITVISRDATVAIPIAGLVREGDSMWVFVVANGKAIRRDVRPGVVSEALAEIVSGVKAGDVIVVGGLDGLPDGAPVSVTP
jgi:RND family efflux transporter MFP subunit